MKTIQFHFFRFLLILMIALLSGCWLTQKDSTGHDTNPVELLASGVHGSRMLQESSATWITNTTTLEQVYSSLNKHQMGNYTAVPDIDFDSYGILLLEMGQRPTGGHAVHFNPSLSCVVDKKAVIHVILKSPAKGMVVTQALTSPFMLFKVRHVDLTSISVLGQNEQPLFEFFIP